MPLEKAGVKIIGTSPDSIDRAEDRKRFNKLVEKLKLRRPYSGTATTYAQALKIANKLVTKVTDSTLDLSVDTDLPDNTVVMVSVSRSYLEKGGPDRYSVDYFSEKSTIGKWKLKD